MKNPLTLAGIETDIFRFVAQHFNHFATAVSQLVHSGNLQQWVVHSLLFDV